MLILCAQCIHRQTQILVAIYTLILGVIVGESDLTVREGSSRQVFVQRSGTGRVNITVFAATVEDYERLQEAASNHECGAALSSLLNNTQVDSVEG